MIESNVDFKLLTASNGKLIGFASLNAQKSLNALNFAMITALKERITAWQSDEQVALIILEGKGDKAFCAGGDVVSLYHELKDKFLNNKILTEQQVASSIASEFFEQEYQLDQLIHHCQKPILVFGDGYVMGGGIGLIAGASHRVATEKTIMAMPEISIGLYPDVGASYFLNQMPNNIGLFLGLTGAMFNASDASYLGLIDFVVSSAQIETIKKQLLTIDWLIDQEDHNKLNDALTHYTKTEKKLTLLSQVKENEVLIESLTSFLSITEIANAIINCRSESKWIKKAQQKFISGSPLSACLTYKQLELCKNLSLNECFAAELNLSKRCCQFPEFSEGVRSLLVNKDKSPQWAFNSVEDIDTQLIDWFFKPINL